MVSEGVKSQAIWIVENWCKNSMLCCYIVAKICSHLEWLNLIENILFLVTIELIRIYTFRYKQMYKHMFMFLVKNGIKDIAIFGNSSL